MRLRLPLLELQVPSVESLRLDDEQRLESIASRLRGLSAVDGVRFFGRGDRLKPIEGVAPVAREFAKHRVGLSTFAAARSADDGAVQWILEIRRTLVTALGVIEAPEAHIAELAAELVTLNELFVSVIGPQRVTVPFSFLEPMDTRVDVTRPPRKFGRLSQRALVDIVHRGGDFEDEEARAVEALAGAELIDGAQRREDGELLIVTWGDAPRRPVRDILGERYAWYVQHGDLAVDPSFNAHGDKEFELFGARAIEGLTAYSEHSATGVKAIVFDEPDDARPDLAELQRRRESEVSPLRRVFAILPARADAERLRAVATVYGVGVLYSDDDGRMWDPFPPEYEADP